MKKTAVILGRFQNYRLHEGYEKLLEYASENYDKVVIILGVSIRKSTDCDPLPAWIRKSIISEAVDLKLYQKLTILTIRDAKVDVDWCNKLDTMIESLDLESNDFHFLVGRDSFEPHYVGKHKTSFHTVPEIPDTSSTKDRENINLKNIYCMTDFAKGIIYATQQPFPRVDPTVDIALFVKRSNGNIQLLLGRKPAENQFRLPGGFVDGTDESFRHSAAREMQEEMNLQVHIKDLQYVDTFNIGDWRYRKGKDNAFTTLFVTFEDESPNQTARDAVKWKLRNMAAGDDLIEAKYVDINDLHDDMLVPEHRILIQKALDHAILQGFI